MQSPKPGAASTTSPTIGAVTISVQANGHALLESTCLGAPDCTYPPLPDWRVPAEVGKLLGELRSRAALSTNTPAAASGQHDDAELNALRNRALSSLLFTASNPQAPEHLTAFPFWRGYLKGLQDLRNGAGSALAGLDEARSGYEPPAYLQRAFAALPVSVEALTLAQVKQFLAAQGVQIAADAVADGDVNAVKQLEDRVVPAVNADDEHAAASVDSNNGSLHRNPPFVVDVGTVAEPEKKPHAGGVVDYRLLSQRNRVMGRLLAAREALAMAEVIAYEARLSGVGDAVALFLQREVDALMRVMVTLLESGAATQHQQGGAA